MIIKIIILPMIITIFILAITYSGRGKETSGFFVAALGENVVGTIAYDRKVIVIIITIIVIFLIVINLMGWDIGFFVTVPHEEVKILTITIDQEEGVLEIFRLSVDSEMRGRKIAHMLVDKVLQVRPFK